MSWSKPFFTLDSYLSGLAAKTAPVQPTCAESSAEENLVLAVGRALKKARKEYLLKLST
ncbi:hypothetical protein F2Q68_00013388 [Brassica cretica]|uniref:Uncharacterized protein n=2 Tax=Brassica cretica TaxID=69181 RepID=A0A8S9HKB4_BRACR|nr:hypothetical protein F2Q68_00013388 [Brassica cretica]KAF3610730.1 hypothetical protein DY000_02045297 [Brassica cretica]